MKKWCELFFKTSYPDALKKSMLGTYNATREDNQQKYLCHAPFKSMLFANNGRVLACCFNRQAISGTYPEQNLKEIWFSKEAEKLRQYVGHNDLSDGCFVCHGQLLNKEFGTVKARMFDHLPDAPSGYPVMMEFDLDNTCNLECVMCNADNSSAIRSKSTLYDTYKSPYDDRFVKELEPFIPHLHQASFAGGEPFLIKLYYDIWAQMMNINPAIRINITTNATVLNDRIKAILEKGYFEISVSLDTVNETTYGLIRKNADFKTVMTNLDYFRDYCKRKGTFFGVWACPLRHNKYEIPELFNYFGERDTEVFLHTVWVPPHVTLWNLTSLELGDLHAFYTAQDLKEDTEVQYKNKQRFLEFTAHIKAMATMALMREKRTPLPQEQPALENYLLCILKQQFMHKGLNVKETALKISECKAKLLYAQTHLTTFIYIEGLTALCQYPDAFIFQIFEAGTEKMICDFFKFLVPAVTAN